MPSVKEFIRNWWKYTGIPSCDCETSRRCAAYAIDSGGQVRPFTKITWHAYRNEVIAECMQCKATWLTWTREWEKMQRSVLTQAECDRLAAVR